MNDFDLHFRLKLLNVDFEGYTLPGFALSARQLLPQMVTNRGLDMLGRK